MNLEEARELGVVSRELFLAAADAAAKDWHSVRELTSSCALAQFKRARVNVAVVLYRAGLSEHTIAELLGPRGWPAVHDAVDLVAKDGGRK